MPTEPLTDSQLLELGTQIGVSFNDQELLGRAMTHQSFVNESKHATESNERLEFLGDSVLGMVVANHLFTEAPNLPEGDLTVRMSQIVRKESLADASVAIGLGEFLVLGNGEHQAGGSERSSNLADAFEAVIGAIFLDQGMESARDFVLQKLRNRISNVLDGQTEKDPKSLLQEYLQAHQTKPPRYELVSQEGPPNDITFTVSVNIENEPVATGSGKRKIEAERIAASKALTQLTKDME